MTNYCCANQEYFKSSQIPIFQLMFWDFTLLSLAISIRGHAIVISYLSWSHCFQHHSVFSASKFLIYFKVILVTRFKLKTFSTENTKFDTGQESFF